MLTAMKLTFLYHPVANLDEAVAFHRDVLGLDEAWREGTETVAFALPESEVQLMLDSSDADEGGASGFFEVDDVDAFYAARRESATWIALPVDQPPIRYAAFRDPAGNLFRIFQNLD
jgi:catechol 2,3-dioxygenase-like lactoylglutathione lyase family enzyme